jgi:deazaflavin-dependent oxidoreductase (nitroreductase family)
VSDTAPADMHAFNRQIIDEFRANGGVVGGPFEGAPMLLLTHTGAKSGVERTTPLVHTRDGDDYVIIASKGGAPSSPDWYHNLLANPEASIEVGDETIPVTARAAEGDERQRLYDAQAAMMPNFAEYARQTDRVIPVIVLSPRD